VGGVFSVALLFLILLAPGALVGYFRPRRVLEFGFIAGVIGDVAYRLGDLLHAAMIHAAYQRSHEARSPTRFRCES